MNLDGNQLTLEAFKQIVYDNEKVSLSVDVVSRLKKSRSIVDKIVDSDEKVYSINTGFGFLSSKTIAAKDLETLQENLIRSHCVGVGDLHSEIESRAILLLRTNCLAKGFSGVRPDLVNLLVEMLNHKIHPAIPKKGSVGASGDLAPLAHLASVVIGEGEAYYQGKKMSGADALKKAGLKALKLKPKEGLSLINGTQQMTALGGLAILEIEDLLDLADLICASSIDGVLGSAKPFETWIHETRPHSGQKTSAQNISKFLEKSQINKSHENCNRVQDAYSFRCAAQVHGAVRDMVQFAKNTILIEMNASTDNPLIDLETGDIVSNGNFHGEPVAMALDVLAIGLSELASISERRISKLIDPQFSGLPAFLVENEGLNSGFMMAQVTAASLVSENKIFAHPASTDSIPTSNEKEDHVSMGPNAARKLQTILKNTQAVLAIESLCGAQALDFRKPLLPGPYVQKWHGAIRAEVPTLKNDRYMHGDIEKISQLIRHSFRQKDKLPKMIFFRPQHEETKKSRRRPLEKN